MLGWFRAQIANFRTGPIPRFLVDALDCALKVKAYHLPWHWHRHRHRGSHVAWKLFRVDGRRACVRDRCDGHFLA